MSLKLMAMIRDRCPPIELVLTGAFSPEAAEIPAHGLSCDKPFRETQVVGALQDFAT